VHPGEWIAVVGRNGAGKSSLLLSIMRLLRTTGTCAVEGLELSKAEHLAARIGFVFQNPEFQFVTGSVQEELGYSLQQEGVPRQELQDRVDRLLRDYELEPLRDRHPYLLSMGQKRRLSVATALVRGQRILLLDEPTFGLDARHTFLLLDRLEQLRAAGSAIVMVTHDPEIAARFATRVWQVDAGRVSETERPLVRPTEAGDGDSAAGRPHAEASGAHAGTGANADAAVAEPRLATVPPGGEEAGRACN
jgi:energy-coupling factor transport system ATP-binding protein